MLYLLQNTEVSSIPIPAVFLALFLNFFFTFFKTLFLKLLY